MSALKEYQRQQKKLRLDDMVSGVQEKQKDYFVRIDQFSELEAQLLTRIDDLEKTLKDLEERRAKLILPTQLTTHRLSVPVATDEGGLGTVTRPTAGQVPVGQVNGTYAPGSISPAFETVVSKIATYSPTSSDGVILCDTTTGSFTINLPSAVGLTGKRFIIKKTDSSVNTVTIDPSAAETIDGQATYLITLQYESIECISNGSNWSII